MSLEIILIFIMIAIVLFGFMNLVSFLSVSKDIDKMNRNLERKIENLKGEIQDLKHNVNEDNKFDVTGDGLSLSEEKELSEGVKLDSEKKEKDYKKIDSLLKDLE